MNRLRYLYKNIRYRSLAPSNKDFDEAVKKLLLDKELEFTPTNWVLMAREVAFPCPDCTDGVFYTGATCFRCKGKGVQNDEDVRRNWGYDTRKETGD